jgi:hypothetical protein
MSNFQEFIENVKAGKIEGLTAGDDGELFFYRGGEWVSGDVHYHEQDHLCAHIRRWLSGKGYKRPLDDDCLALFRKEDENEGPRFLFTEGTELDWHIDSANWVIKQEPTP